MPAGSVLGPFLIIYVSGLTHPHLIRLLYRLWGSCSVDTFATDDILIRLLHHEQEKRSVEQNPSEIGFRRGCGLFRGAL